jgi:TolB protein
MDRRHFVLAGGALAAMPPLAEVWRASATHAGAGDEISGTMRRLTEPGRGDNRATYMPDGTTLLFASKRTGKSQLWAMDPDGGRPRRFHESGANDHGRVAPNADGTCVAFSSDRDGESAIYVLAVASGKLACVSDPNFWSFGPSWSSQDLIAFFSKKGGNAMNTWVVRPDGASARQITDQPGESRQPWWSPDGRRLALSADHGTGVYEVWLLTPDGSGARRITREGSYEQPFWSPEGRRIAVSAQIGESHRRIYVMGADGADPQPIRQPERVDNVHPAWSPDGRSIVFTSGAAADGSICVFDLG